MPIRKVGSEMPTSEIGLEQLGEEALAPQARVDAHQDAEHDGEDRRAEGEFERRGHALGEQVETGWRNW